jgi:agmatine/peptidylarginine deiminase
MSIYGCTPAEFEKQSAIILGCNELLPYHPQAMVDIVATLIERIPLVAIVDSEEQRKHLVTLLCDWGLPAHLLHFVSLPVKGMWVRDYGPSFVRCAQNGVVILDAEYLEVDRREDDNAPSELAALLRVPVTHVPMLIEGGNILGNGQGLCLTTSALMTRNRQRGHTEADVRRMLNEYYGYDEVVVLRELLSEPTGHVDMFATFVAPDVVVVGQYAPKVDPVNADILDENARALSQVQTRTGPLKVVRIPMPTNRGSVWRTHTNVIFANDTLLVPTFGAADVDAEQKAFETYASLLPGWDVVGIEAGTLIKQRGALRCVSIHVPWLEDRFPSPKSAARERGTYRLTV